MRGEIETYRKKKKKEATITKTATAAATTRPRRSSGKPPPRRWLRPCRRKISAPTRGKREKRGPKKLRPGPRYITFCEQRMLPFRKMSRQPDGAKKSFFAAFEKNKKPASPTPRWKKAPPPLRRNTLAAPMFYHYPIRRGTVAAAYAPAPRQIADGIEGPSKVAQVEPTAPAESEPLTGHRIVQLRFRTLPPQKSNVFRQPKYYSGPGRVFRWLDTDWKSFGDARANSRGAGCVDWLHAPTNSERERQVRFINARAVRWGCEKNRCFPCESPRRWKRERGFPGKRRARPISAPTRLLARTDTARAPLISGNKTILTGPRNFISIYFLGGLQAGSPRTRGAEKKRGFFWRALLISLRLFFSGLDLADEWNFTNVRRDTPSIRRSIARRD